MIRRVELFKNRINPLVHLFEYNLIINSKGILAINSSSCIFELYLKLNIVYNSWLVSFVHLFIFRKFFIVENWFPSINRFELSDQSLGGCTRGYPCQAEGARLGQVRCKYVRARGNQLRRYSVWSIHKSMPTYLQNLPQIMQNQGPVWYRKTKVPFGIDSKWFISKTCLACSTLKINF